MSQDKYDSFVAGSLIATCTNDADEEDLRAIAKKHGITVVNFMQTIKIAVLKVPEGKEEEYMALLEAEEDILHVHRNGIKRTL